MLRINARDLRDEIMLRDLDVVVEHDREVRIQMRAHPGRLVQIRNRKKQHIDTTRPAEGVVLHGSCVIFSQRYLARHPEPFYAKTFMYYEMEILDWLCRQDGSVVRYDPSISVLHYQYVASKMEYRSIVRRSKFVIDCLLDSLDAAEELILASGRTTGSVPKRSSFCLSSFSLSVCGRFRSGRRPNRALTFSST